MISYDDLDSVKRKRFENLSIAREEQVSQDQKISSMAEESNAISQKALAEKSLLDNSAFLENIVEEKLSARLQEREQSNINTKKGQELANRFNQGKQALAQAVEEGKVTPEQVAGAEEQLNMIAKKASDLGAGELLQIEEQGQEEVEPQGNVDESVAPIDGQAGLG